MQQFQSLRITVGSDLGTVVAGVFPPRCRRLGREMLVLDQIPGHRPTRRISCLIELRPAKLRIGTVRVDPIGRGRINAQFRRQLDLLFKMRGRLDASLLKPGKAFQNLHGLGVTMNPRGELPCKIEHCTQ